MPETNEILQEILSLEPDLARIKKIEIETKKEYEELREKIFALMTVLEGGEDRPSRILCEGTGMAIFRYFTPKEPETQIDIDALQQNLTEEQWELITDPVRIFNEDRLTSAVEQGLIKLSVVEICSSTKNPEPRLKYDDMTKQEKLLWEHRQNKVETPNKKPIKINARKRV